MVASILLTHISDGFIATLPYESFCPAVKDWIRYGNQTYVVKHRIWNLETNQIQLMIDDPSE